MIFVFQGVISIIFWYLNQWVLWLPKKIASRYLKVTDMHYGNWTTKNMRCWFIIYFVISWCFISVCLMVKQIFFSCIIFLGLPYHVFTFTICLDMWKQLNLITFFQFAASKKYPKELLIFTDSVLNITVR